MERDRSNADTGATDGNRITLAGVRYDKGLGVHSLSQIQFALGYSHPVIFDIPTGIEVAIDKQTHLVITGIDNQLVGQVAANIRSLRKPDPYKQKGIRYTGEQLKKKVGKTGA